MVGRSLLSLTVLVIVLALLANLGSGEDSPSAEFDINSHRIVEPDQYTWKTYVGEEIVLSGGSSKDASTYRWDFGDGVTSESEISTIAHKYQYIGEYAIVLEVEDDEGNTDTRGGNITIIDRPQAQLVLRDAITYEIIDPDQTQILAGHDILFDASETRGEIMTYHYGVDLERAFIPQLLKESPYVQRTYNTPGEYKIGLRVVDSLGNRSQMGSDEFIEIEVVDPISVASENDSDASPLVGDLVGVLLFIGVICVFVIAFRKKSDPDRSWGTGVKVPEEVPEDERSPFYFKRVRESGSLNYTRPSTPCVGPSEFESTITDRISPPQFTYSEFRKH